MSLNTMLHRYLPLFVAATCVLPVSVKAQSAASAAPHIVERVDEGRLATLTGNTRPEARAQFDRGGVTPDLPMRGMILVLRRSPEQQAAADAFVESQYQAGSPNFHHWLTPDEVGEKFGPAQADIDTVTNWLLNRGFAVDAISKNRLNIEFSGTASQVQAAFHTEIHNLQVTKRDRTVESHIANMKDPQIPAALTPVVVGVQALHNFYPRPLHKLGAQVRRNSQTGKWDRISAPAAPSTVAAPATAKGSKSITPKFYGGATSGVEDIAPYDFATIYNVLPLWNAGTAIDGTGQKIAIVATSDINPADVTTFRAAFGLPAYSAPTGSTPGLSIIHPNTAPGDCSTGDPSCANSLLENSLDVEWSGAIAKKANIILVASSPGTGGTFAADPVYVSTKYIVDHNTASIMNISYGECELGLGNTGNAGWNTLLQSAAMEGIASFIASGDEGSASCDAGQDASVPYGAVFGLSVSGVASTPYATAVGGTDFNWGWVPNGDTTYWNTTSGTGQSNAKGYIPESPWNSTCTNPFFVTEVNHALSENLTAAQVCDEIGQGNITSGGQPLYSLVDVVGGSGGVSGCTTSTNFDVTTCTGGYAKPSWQTGVGGIPSDGKRDIPDVSFFAASGFSGSAYIFCASAIGSCSYTPGSEPVGSEVGGTSVASPIMAGVMALINQKVGSSQGLPNAELYKLAHAQTYSSCKSESIPLTGSSCVFNDIDTGTIAMPCSLTPTPGPPAIPVLDCTGSGATFFGEATNYPATAVFDMATGLGSMNVTNLVNAFATDVASSFSVSPTSLTFTSTLVGQSAATQSVTVTNSDTTSAVTIGPIAITGTNLSLFTQTNTCGNSLAASSTCKITVTFTPTAAGTFTATLNIPNGFTASPITVGLTGTGALPTPAITLAPTSLTFASTGVGQAAATQKVTVTNSGTAVLDINTVSITGTNASSFSETTTCGTGVAIGVSCTITVTFTPDAVGNLTASISIADNVTGSPQTVTLTGVGAEVGSYTLTAAPVSVAHGSTGTSAITATGTGGFVGPNTITLSGCVLAGSPTGAVDLPTCTITTASFSFAPAATTASGGVVTIHTTAAAAMVKKAQLDSPSASKPWAGLGVVAAAGLLLLGIPARRRKWKALLGAFLFIATLGVLSGCGGGSSNPPPPPPNPGTTPGTYTFTITGKDSGGVQQTTTLTVTVS